MPEFAKGGFIEGPGGPNDDSIPAMLKGCSVHPQPHPRKILDGCDGEWVISASAVRDIASAELDRINRSAQRRR